MEGPKDEMASARGDPGRVRASHADREQVIDVLKAAFVQGRLTKDELDTRATQAFGSRTYAELATLTADLPAGPAPAPLPRKPAREKAQPAGRVPMIMTTTLLTAGLWTAAVSAHPGNGALNMLLFSCTLVWLGVLILTGAATIESRKRRRSASATRRTSITWPPTAPR
jgi:hypothetical protein